MRCAQCQEENIPGTRFCRRCGAKMPDAAASNVVGRLVLIAVLIVGAVAALLVMRRDKSSTAPATSASMQSPGVTLGIAYGTEKESWLKWAATEFAKTPEGQNIKLDLKPMGSLESAHKIKDDQTINVWSPASSVYKDVFIRDWKDAHYDANPIAREAQLALTPMVFVFWDERYEPFVARYGNVNFANISAAMKADTGWASISNKPDWGLFKFSHTSPGSSNSGLITLLLMGQDYYRKSTPLEVRDVADQGFQDRILSTERRVCDAHSDLVSSTGDLMRKMVQRGPSSYDAIFVYESVAIDRLKQAEGRYGPLKIAYPSYNIWNDNPYYVLDVPWSSPEQRKAANAFLDFLLTPRVQHEALVHGFRPADTSIPINEAQSPFVNYAASGLQIKFPGILCDPPRPEAIENLLHTWSNSRASDQ